MQQFFSVGFIKITTGLGTIEGANSPLAAVAQQQKPSTGQPLRTTSLDIKAKPSTHIGNALITAVGIRCPKDTTMPRS